MKTYYKYEMKRSKRLVLEEYKICEAYNTTKIHINFNIRSAYFDGTHYNYDYIPIVHKFNKFNKFIMLKDYLIYGIYYG